MHKVTGVKITSSRDSDAPLWVCWMSFTHFDELGLDLDNHLVGSLADSGHCQVRESVENHCSNDEAGESGRLQNINNEALRVVSALLDSDDVGSEEGEGD